MKNSDFIINIDTIKKWSSKFRGWHYYPTHVISANMQTGMNFQYVDCPLVYQIGGNPLWYMFYTGYDGMGYQTMLAKSQDLINWKNEGLVMGYGEEGMFDNGGVTFGGAMFQSNNLKESRILKKIDGRYHVLYGSYPKQGGYEIRPGAEGIAWSYDGINWNREKNRIPILSIKGAKEWEKDCIYQPWLIEHNNRYYNFYNAANGIYEQIGIAVSNDLMKWERFVGNPVLVNGEKGSYDEIFSSDGKVFYDEDHWVMIYFGVSAKCNIWNAHIMVAYSIDLINWIKDPEPLCKAGDHPYGLDREFAHKVSLVYNHKNDVFYMYYTAVGDKGRGIGLITSKKIDQ